MKKYLIMKDLKKVLIALDRSEMDEVLLRYGLFLAEVLEAESVDLLHVEQEESHELDLLQKLEASFEADEQFKNEIMHKAYEMNPDTRLNLSAHLFRGNPFNEILKFTRTNDIDLLVVGKKEEHRGAGIVAHRLSRKAPCSVIFIPPRPELQMDAILMPTDFSDYSAMAFREAMFFRQKFPGIRLVALHVYHVPIGYYSTGKSYDEFAEIMKRNAEKEFEKFVKNNKLEKLELEPILVLGEEHNPAEKIHELAIRENCDLILVGARGHSMVSSIVLGSTTEKLLRITKKIPVFVMKRKGETLKLLDILMNI